MTPISKLFRAGILLLFLAIVNTGCQAQEKKDGLAEAEDRKTTDADGGEAPGHYLFPLILSAGPDSEFGVNTNFASGNTEKYSTYAQPNDPYGPRDSGDGSFLFGTINDASIAGDNIHNHELRVGL